MIATNSANKITNAEILNMLLNDKNLLKSVRQLLSSEEKKEKEAERKAKEERKEAERKEKEERQEKERKEKEERREAERKAKEKVDQIVAVNPDSIKIFKIKFSNNFGFIKIIDKIANGEYKSIGNIVSDLTKVIRFIDTEGGIFIRKDYDAKHDVPKMSYLSIPQMQTYASVGKKIKFNSNEKPITLWDIISENRNLFTVVGTKFYSDYDTILSFFHGYKYENKKLNDDSDEEIIKWLQFVKECIANDGNHDENDENKEYQKLWEFFQKH